MANPSKLNISIMEERRKKIKNFIFQERKVVSQRKYAHI
jgi:hypothetical protein